MPFFETWQQAFLAGLVMMVFLAFVKEWISAELVALSALLACVVTGILSVNQDDPFNALKVFSHPAPITVACMFVISAALERTGVIETLGVWFEKIAGNSPTRMLVVMMALVAFLSSFANNTPVVVVFLPIVLAICRKRDFVASKFLIPLSYAAIVGGTMTIIGTSTNLIALGIAEKEGIQGLGMFSVTPVGIVFVVITFVYMLTLGKKLLPDRATLATLIDTHSSREFITHAFVKKDSNLDGKAFSESRIAKMKKARVLEVLRDGVRLQTPLNEIVFESGDEIVFKGVLEGVMGISKTEGIDVRGNDSRGLEGIRTESALLMEGIIGPESSMTGKSLKELNFRQRFGVLILAVHRRGRNLRERFEDEKLAFGDTLLVQGPAEKMNQLFQQRDFINLSERKHAQVRQSKAPIAIGALLLFMIMGALGGRFGIPAIPIVQLAFTSALIVLLARCVEPQEAYRAVDWKVIFMIFGMLGFGMAIEKSGLAQRIADSLIHDLGIENPYLMLALMYLLAAVMTEIISNNAVAVLLTPLAIVVAHTLDASALPFIIAIMFGSSASFSTPIGYQTNTFVYGAGGYKFGDFFKVGAPLAFILWGVASFLIPILWPFHP
ncbi:SLC13 family permease [Verrucomicrobiaceae bacterium N1E253]|uniref:SLC13 family permease n=1 Tax=Oceaniferula marina TaxID=2748318 RepID=A0A851GQZ9_9BACT|nr:SLC13 family permease [Oceaniferula marina]NWK57407.1 SLC13 family permease [Oceaniferula marina]